MVPSLQLKIGPVPEQPFSPPVFNSFHEVHVFPSSWENAASSLLRKIPSVTASNNGRFGSLRSNHVATRRSLPSATSTISPQENMPGTLMIRSENRTSSSFHVLP